MPPASSLTPNVPFDRKRLLRALTRQGLAALESLESAGCALFDLAETSVGWKGTIWHCDRGITLIVQSADLAVGELARCIVNSGGPR